MKRLFNSPKVYIFIIPYSFICITLFAVQIDLGRKQVLNDKLVSQVNFYEYISDIFTGVYWNDISFFIGFIVAYLPFAVLYNLLSVNK